VPVLLAVILALVACFYVVGLFARDTSTTWRRAELLGQIAAELRGSSAGNQAWGKHRGVAVTFGCEALQNRGSSSEYWTVIDADITHAPPLELHVRRQGWHANAAIARGKMIDVEIGDPVFDPMFVVEAAPADVVRALLDPELRGFLASHSSAKLDTVVLAGHRKVLRLTVTGWIAGVADAMANIAAVARAASRIRDAFAVVDSANAPVESGAPYRQQLDETRSRAAEEVRAREIAHLVALRKGRSEALPISLADTVFLWMFGIAIVATLISAAFR
jgi:hypothetical protein